MKVYFHIGPHKTGTTSIQAYLLERFGGERPGGSIWYPQPERLGPGHALLAEEIAECVSCGGPNPIQALLTRAERASVEKVLLSSENFSLASERELRLYADGLRHHHVTLLSTQNSLIDRAASRWQQWVKSRLTYDFSATTEKILESPGYRPTLLEEFATAIQPAVIAIVYVLPNDPPQRLPERMVAALGVPMDESVDSGKILNEGLGLIEAEILRRLNQLLDEYAPKMPESDYLELRGLLLRQFRIPRWGTLCPRVRIELTEENFSLVSTRAHGVADAIERLGGKWKVHEYGSREALTAMKGSAP